MRVLPGLRYVPVLWLLVLASIHARGQDLHITLPDGGDRAVSTIRPGGVLYGSVNDLAGAFSIDVGEQSDPGRLELKSPPRSMKLTGGSPFVVVIDQSRRQRVHQLTMAIVRAGSSSYAPLQEFLPLFSETFNKPLRLDLLLLRADQAPPPAAIVVGKPGIEEKTNGMLIRIPCDQPPTEYECWLRDDGWLYVTIGNSRTDVDAINGTKPAGLVRQVVAIQSPGSLQLTFKLSGKIAASEIFREEDSNNLLVSLRLPGAEDKMLLAKKRREIQEGLDHQRKRWGLDVIILDAGHGGHDFGAIGVKGSREKDVTLGIVLKLGKLLAKNLPGVKVVYTRDDDRFVPLYRRGQIANESDGKLFISVHANSLRRKPNPIRGFEVYLLRPGRTDEAISIAERENSVIELEEGYEDRYQKLTDENFILVTMAQSAYLRASEVFAQVAMEEMEDHLSIPNRGVRQAGFLVLVGASMPNVLVETAYLSNREDERFLSSKSGQQELAQALFSAIRRYKEEYEKLLNEGKDVGDAAPRKGPGKPATNVVGRGSD